MKLDKSHIYLIGGNYKDSSESTYTDHLEKSREVLIFNPLDNFSYIQGPSLNQGRVYPDCAVMHDDEGSSYIVVVDGHEDRRSVEILDSNHLVDGQNQWKQGKKIFTVKVALWWFIVSGHSFIPLDPSTSAIQKNYPKNVRSCVGASRLKFYSMIYYIVTYAINL